MKNLFEATTVQEVKDYILLIKYCVLAWSSATTSVLEPFSV